MAKKGNFFSALTRSNLVINQASAGAGMSSLLGFGALAILATVFFVTENYFIAMFVISIGLLLYVTGSDLPKLLVSSFTIFFSSRHLIAKAAYLQDTLVILAEKIGIRRNRRGEIVAGPIPEGTAIVLPDNPLVRDLQRVREGGKKKEYADYVTHSYYSECHELYEFSHTNLEFVANSMPLFGLIGTIVGLIAMFDNLGGDVTVETLSPQLALALKTTLYGAVFSSVYKIIGARFEQRLKSLDYDYEEFEKGLQVLVENNATIEVEA